MPLKNIVKIRKKDNDISISELCKHVRLYDVPVYYCTLIMLVYSADEDWFRAIKMTTISDFNWRP